jgi:hypothetical protein
VNFEVMGAVTGIPSMKDEMIAVGAQNLRSGYLKRRAAQTSGLLKLKKAETKPISY